MMLHRVTLTWLFLTATHVLCVGSAVSAPRPTTRPAEGLRDNTPAIFALTGARVVPAPGRELPCATVIVRNGTITEVGVDVSIPGDARVIDLSGRTIYAGLIDGYGEVTLPSVDEKQGTPYWNALVTPQQRVAAHYSPSEATQKKLRTQGIGAQLVAPAKGIVKGTSSLVLTGELANQAGLLEEDVAQHLRLTSPRRRDQYPNSPMGAVALARQAFYDAEWYHSAWAAYRGTPTLPRPERNAALAALLPNLDGERPVVADALNELYFLRADDFAREFGLRLVLRGSGHEYRQVDAIRRTGRAVLLPVNFPKPPNVSTAEATHNVSLEQLMHWDLAPENPARLEAAGVEFALTTDGLEDTSQFLKRVRLAVRRGLTPAGALQALTTTPAEIFDIAHLLGKVESGMLANLLIADGDLFAKETQVVEVWVAGHRYQIEPQSEQDPRGRWQVNVTTGSPLEFELRLTGKPNRLTGKLSVPSQQASDEKDKAIDLKQVGYRNGRLSAMFDSTRFERAGVARMTVIIPAVDSQNASWLGSVTWPDGSRSELTATRIGKTDDDQADEAEGEGEETTAEENESNSEQAKGDKPDSNENDDPQSQAASFDVNYPLGAYGVDRERPVAAAVLLRNATIWTSGPEGVLEGASIYLRDGKIVAVGKEIDVPSDVEVIDLAGKHVTPGIIDCHSHMATDGGVNESGQAITAEVRIGDFLNSDDINIYRQLAGGVTTSNILHGSANPIGGQNQVIKLRWGGLYDELRFEEAPPGIKFALGENVTRANWSDPSDRYPRSRMGVEQIMRDAFHAAEAYSRRWREWQQNRRGLPPRRDLELEALAEILAGERWIHCHSYRQDEILALIRTLDDFDVQIGTFQHILEGYKVADEMAKHGAMGSAFSDWWAYKFEVYDAIPYAGALMHRAGVVVSFNSDDRELARHLNHEAAKAVKYGGVPPAEALKFVTLNPAHQLRIDDYVGSLEAGKHADLVVWSGPPLSILSRCEQTWIDGRKYFDLTVDQEARRLAAERRNTLVQKILASKLPMRSSNKPADDPANYWAREDIFCGCRKAMERERAGSGRTLD